MIRSEDVLGDAVDEAASELGSYHLVTSEMVLVEVLNFFLPRWSPGA